MPDEPATGEFRVEDHPDPADLDVLLLIHADAPPLPEPYVVGYALAPI